MWKWWISSQITNSDTVYENPTTRHDPGSGYPKEDARCMTEQLRHYDAKVASQYSHG
jgi:hypothetical protein